MKLLYDVIPYWGQEPDEQTQMQMAACERTADRVAFMADHHLGYAVPVGGVVAYRDHISPSGVGYDIACGNKAVRLDADADEVRAKIDVIMDDVFETLSFGIQFGPLAGQGFFLPTELLGGSFRLGIALA